MTKEQIARLEKGLGYVSDVAKASAPIAGAYAPEVLLGAAILDAALAAARDHGKTPEEILNAIRMPKPLDMSFRADVDAELERMK